MHHARVDEWWKRGQKYDFIEATGDLTGVSWQKLQPDARGNWLTEGMAIEFDLFVPIGTKEARSNTSGAETTIFGAFSAGVNTGRDIWVYSFSRVELGRGIKRFISTYNDELSAWEKREDKTASVDSFVTANERRIKWSRNLKRDFERREVAVFSEAAFRRTLHRPFKRMHLYFADMLVDERGSNSRFFPAHMGEGENIVVCVPGIGNRQAFGCLASRHMVSYDLAFEKAQAFPFYVYDEDGSNRRENITDWALAQYRGRYGADVTKWDIFHYVYGILHSPEYRSRYAENLKRDLPRIPFVSPEAFRAFVDAGKRLAELHVGYESVKPHPLKHVEKTPFTWRVERMKLSTDKTKLIVNESLTLDGIPPEVFEYRLGNRSALEWVVDQYRVKTDERSGITHDPNDPEDPEYIVRLVKQVVTVSLETVRIVKSLPPLEIVT